jgi:hypothetical protein
VRGDPIISGQLTTGYPTAVFLSMECTGTLISPSVVLTAKHCTEGASGVQVYFTSQAYEGNPIPVVDIQNHPQTDIALLGMASPAQVMPSPVFGGVQGSLDQHLGETVTYVGFGARNNNPPPNDGFGPKQEGKSPLDHLEGDGLLTGYDPGGAWHCFGDSGGPAFMTLNGVHQIAGVISAGAADQCGVPGDLSIRTDSHYEWIIGYAVQRDGPASCGQDGRCADECAAEDPDCSGGGAPPPPPANCAGDGSCNTECGASDPDCGETPPPPEPSDECDRDGICDEMCGTLDPDCPTPTAPSYDAAPESSESSGSCALGTRGDASAWGVLLLSALGLLLKRLGRFTDRDPFRRGRAKSRRARLRW